MNINDPDLIKSIFCKNELLSYDPYDIWKTKLGITARKIFYKNKCLGIIPAGILTIFDLYINNHLRLGYKKQEYPVVRALAALTLINLYESDEDIANLQFAKIHIDWLINNSSQGYHGCCWGLGFNWVYSKNKTYDKNTPFSTHTPYPLEALIKYYKITKELPLLNSIKSIFQFLEHDLKVMEENADTLVISYGINKDRIVTNANAYIMYMYALLLKFIPEKKEYIENKIYKIYNFIRAVQCKNGSWLYSPYDNNSFIDCFHSAFIIKNIIKTNALLKLENHESVVNNGYQYILNDFLEKNDFLFKRFSINNKISLIKFDLYDNAEMLNLALLVGDLDTSSKLDIAIKKKFINNNNFISSSIDIFGLVKNKNHLRWAVAPYLYALSSMRD
jgi:hypothetical protein